MEVFLLSIDEYKFKQARQEPIVSEYDEILPDTISLFGEEPNPDISPTELEGTPVDPVAPPTEIVNGTDLLNGYNGTVDEE
jgi:hypothetical protein